MFTKQVVATLLVLLPVALAIAVGAVTALTRTIRREADRIDATIRLAKAEREESMIEELNRLTRISGIRSDELAQILSKELGDQIKDGGHRA